MVSPAAGAAAPRRLLRRLRDIMAAPGTAQERLNQVVKVIAANMVAEVCSVYLMRAGQVLELFATEGLNPAAVHRTRLRVGEGLVGEIAAHARPLNLADAQSHPHFAYRPETGEDPYHSLLGVPILRGGWVIGVLVVQNRTQRHYDEEEVEALQTIAMVLAELVGSGELVPPGELQEIGGIVPLPQRLEGMRLSDGLAMGTAVFHQPRIVVHRLVADDPKREQDRLKEAVDAFQRAVDRMLADQGLSGHGEHIDILEAYRMFAHDRGWFGRINEAIGTGLTAEAAVKRVQDDMRARMAQVADSYLRERLLDLEDLSNRLLQHLSGEVHTGAASALPNDVIVVARAMGPAELLDYDRRHLRALVLEEGSPTAHVAIVARALDIPAVGRATGALTTIETGDAVIVDGDSGLVYIRPGEDVRHAYDENLQVRARRRAAYAAERDKPAVTLDGERISLQINAGVLMDLAQLDETGADGVGLYRTELAFMMRGSFPGAEAQAAIYAKVLDQAGDRAVVFRTLDIGADKPLPYFRTPHEENPAMGWRSIRIALDRPALLRQQLRALLKAAVGRRLSLMFPMIAEVAEFDSARALLEQERARLATEAGPPPEEVRVGAMLEVPALAWQLPALLQRVDFLSIGGNDLMQFMFASDRGNPRLVDRYDLLSPAVLTFLRSLVAQCEAAGVAVSLCGEMAGRPLDAMALIGLGLRTLSMPPAAIGPVRTMIRSVAIKPLRRFMDTLSDLPDHSLRGRLQLYAHDRGVVI